MRYSSSINNVKAKEWGLNLQQAYLFSWLYELPSWATTKVIDSQIFYFASKTKAIEELSLLSDKIDTIYRYYKQLEDKGLIVVKKIEKKDFISLTDKAKEWNNKNSNSEINPSIGNKSEKSTDLEPKNSEINPTYNNTIYSNNDKYIRYKQFETKEYSVLRITDEEHNKLLQANGKEKLILIYNKLVQFSNDNPKRFKTYKSHYLAINKWVVQAVENDMIHEKRKAFYLDGKNTETQKNNY